MPRRYITVFDTETTGFDPKEDYIYQIAAKTLEVKEDHVKDVDNIEIKMTLPEEGLKKLEVLREEKPEVVLHDEKVWSKEAMSQVQGVKRFCKYLEAFKCKANRSKKGMTYYTSIMAGHNVDFDLRMLRASCDRYEVFCPCGMWGLDTIALFHWITVMDSSIRIPKKFSLGNLADIFGVSLENAHDAMSDVDATVCLIKAVYGGGGK